MIPSVQSSLRVMNPANQSHIWGCVDHCNTPTQGCLIIYLFFLLEVVGSADSQLADLLNSMKTIQEKERQKEKKEN